MTVGTLYPPIAAATVVNVFLFALMWRASQVEKRRGEAPWYLTVGLLAYIIPLGLYAYSAIDRPLAGAGDYFAAALMGQAMGVVVVGSLVEAFVSSRGQPVRRRAFPMILALVLLCGMFASLVTS